MLDSKIGLMIGCVMAFVGLWMPFVLYVNMPSSDWVFSGWNVLINLNNGDKRQATDLFHLLPFLLSGISYIAIIVLVLRSSESQDTLMWTGFLVVSAVLFHIVMGGMAMVSMFSPKIFDLGFWNQLKLGIGAYISIIGMALAAVGWLGWLVKAHQLPSDTKHG
jgi:hypothetical protein